MRCARPRARPARRQRAIATRRILAGQQITMRAELCADAARSNARRRGAPARAGVVRHAGGSASGRRRFHAGGRLSCRCGHGPRQHGKLGHDFRVQQQRSMAARAVFFRRNLRHLRQQSRGFDLLEQHVQRVGSLQRHQLAGRQPVGSRLRHHVGNYNLDSFLHSTRRVHPHL